MLLRSELDNAGDMLIRPNVSIVKIKDNMTLAVESVQATMSDCLAVLNNIY